MASVSSATSSLGNTSLRGYGGMASGIDRDEIIEQMTLGTTTKIENKRKEIYSTRHIGKGTNSGVHTHHMNTF